MLHLDMSGQVGLEFGPVGAMRTVELRDLPTLIGSVSGQALAVFVFFTAVWASESRPQQT